MSDPIRELHRIIDARIREHMGSTPPLEVARGTVTTVTTNLRTVAATLDGSDTPTPGITYPSGMTPVVGDDVLVLRRRDGLLLVLHVLGRD